MFIHNINPTILTLGPFEIRWYGLVYVLGALFLLWWLLYWQKRGALDLTKDEVLDFMLYIMLGVLIGARLFMIIWDPSIYLFHPIELLKIWEGGMSFHGGFVGMVIAAIIFCKQKKISFFKMADMVSFPSMINLAFGRIANFINGELPGRVFDGSWCVVFPGVDECRHPSTLYAATKRFAIASWLYILTLQNFTKQFRPGFVFWNLVFFEGLGRFMVDFFREDVLYFGFSTGQWMSLVMVIVAGIYLGLRHKADFSKLFNE